MKLYDMIQVYSSGSTVIMHMHYIWPVLHMTSYLVAINKNRDMCFDMKNGNKKKKKKKKTYFSGEIPVNDCRNVWRGLKSIRLIKTKFLRISKVSCKESSRSQSLMWTKGHFATDLPSLAVSKYSNRRYNNWLILLCVASASVSSYVFILLLLFWFCPVLKHRFPPNWLGYR